MKVFDEVTNKATVTSEVRVNDGFNAETIIASKTFTANSKKHHSITCDTAALAVILPDATTLPNGWEINVENVAASSETFEVQTSDLAAIKSAIPAGYTYKMVLVDNGTAVGSWRLYRMNTDSTMEAESFVGTFASGDFVAGVYTVTKATHGIAKTGLNISVEEGAAYPYTKVTTGVSVASDGAVSLTVSQDPDNSFDGRVIIS